MINKEEIKFKRILTIDYGLKRVGLAYTDALHISINYLPFLDNNDKLLDKIEYVVKNNSIDIILIGKPPHIHNNEEFKNSLELFISNIKEKLNLNVITFDESDSTEDSYKLMAESNVKKSKRKINKDSISAGVILKNFLKELE